MKPYKFKLTQKGDENGMLTIGECGNEIPFDIKRIFYIYDTKKDVVRGKHANRKSEFVIINISGSSKIKVLKSDYEEVFELKTPHEALYIPKMYWKEMYDFSDNSIMLILSNELYDKDEYIRDFDEYMKGQF